MAWRPASEPPDTERGVLIYGPGCEEPEKGYHDSAGRGWRYWSGSSAHEVTHWRELPPPPSNRPTVRVRAACVVDEDGEWAVAGNSWAGEESAANNARFDAQDGGGGRLSWAEWDAPLPEPVEAETIEAEVCDG